jgi:hypothetical protein
MVTTMLTMMTSGTAPEGGLFASGGSAVSDMSQVHPRDLLDRYISFDTFVHQV